MSDMPTIIETGKNCENGNCWGGSGLAAGLGGLVGSWFGQGWGGGWGGYGNRGAQVGADVALANSLDHVSDQVQQGSISQLQSANGLQQSISGAAAGVTNGIYQQTISNLQGQNQQNMGMLQGFANVGQQLCCSTGRLSQEIDQSGDQTVAAINVNSQMMADRLCGLNQSVINQGYQNQLQTKDVLTQLQGQHADLKATIIEQGCQDRETMREIAAQAVRDKLAEANAKIANLETRQALTDSNQNQTLYMMNQIQQLFQQYKPTTAAAGA